MVIVNERPSIAGPRGYDEMIAALKSLFFREKPWQEEIQNLWKTLVPIGGEAETLQGELVRSIQTLADECHRNGWMNWDDTYIEKIEVLKRFLPDPKVFSEEERTLILSAINHIRYCGEKGADQGQLGYDKIKLIAQKVVIWCRSHKKLIYKKPDQTWLDF